MIATLDASSVLDITEQYLASYGKNGAVGVFGTTATRSLRRGARVVLQTARGLELGSILGPASLRQARLLGAVAAGQLLRAFTADDEADLQRAATLAHELFHASRQQSHGIEILDVEVLLDGRQAIFQYVGPDAGLDALAQQLEQRFSIEIRFENLATPALLDETEEHGGCGKPDCGKSEGGCTSCSTGGGCSSCGTGKVDMKSYFAHLRDKMETQQRVPLL